MVAPQPPPPPPPPPPHLLNLPAEIRNVIYDSIILASLKLGEGVEGGECIPLRQALTKQPTLAQTCRKLRREVLSMWYARGEKLLIDIEQDIGPCYGWAEFCVRPPITGKGEGGFECMERHGEYG
ncbi:uncharacterized protein MYCFIDRAFT_171659 [Pseudocercospora fijiensis CIRAD86]|uniref:F-box domain-containing protein n=1 Tax=Pseudocercospora fijiensis (strain CIRAD86) TaxID=383855 RepID=M3B8Y1_PSEFD|nr:uncharacterized protein MYCFIDRAFT_171659 [Pseudocercospora fijiensis CIRAD86]EME85782.1 hypothetical protein MYCFIDRAFT_171659 [Pseudocercospora fijiensis CIRAD86]